MGGNHHPENERSIGWTFGCGLPGASHLRAGKPCQDAYSALSGACAGEQFITAAVADGLGDARYDRSEHGAQFAVEAAIGEVVSLFRASLVESPQWLADAFVRDFPLRTWERWKKLVQEHAAEPREKRGKGCPVPFFRYGTTLLVGMATREVLLLGQLGDGDVLLKRQGCTVERVFAPDPDLVGRETHSLSSEDPVPLWRISSEPRTGGERFILATDGLSDSFASGSDFLTFTGDLLDRCDHYPLDAVTAALPGWLRRCSEEGSGDDISLVAAGLGALAPVSLPDNEMLSVLN